MACGHDPADSYAPTSEQASARTDALTPTPHRPKVGPETIEAAKAFISALKADFAREDFESPIVAGWTSSGILLVACRGSKANTLDALLQDNDLAIPDGRQPEQRA